MTLVLALVGLEETTLILLALKDRKEPESVKLVLASVVTVLSNPSLWTILADTTAVEGRESRVEYAGTANLV